MVECGFAKPVKANRPSTGSNPVLSAIYFFLTDIELTTDEEKFLILTVVHSLFAFSCSQVEYTRNSANYTSNSQTFEESNVQSSYEEKEKYKTAYRKSNLEVSCNWKKSFGNTKFNGRTRRQKS